jgi:hypothetical protein
VAEPEERLLGDWFGDQAADQRRQGSGPGEPLGPPAHLVVDKVLCAVVFDTT